MYDGSDQAICTAGSGKRRARTFTAALLIALALTAPAHAEDPAQTEEPAQAEKTRSVFTLEEPAQAEKTRSVFTNEELLSGLNKTFDLMITRPLGVGWLLFGVVCFIPAAALAEVPPGLGGKSKRWRSSVGEVWQIFVGDQIEATFMTPLGEFEEEY